MLVNIPLNSPALWLLTEEHIDFSTIVPVNKDIKAQLKIAVLNLMPLKITTEADILRLLSNSPLAIHLDFVNIESHAPKNIPVEHLEEFYKPFSSIKNDYYDGFIVTGAPVELLPFQEVNYWEELTGIFEWARTNVRSTLYICWGAQAALHHFYGVPKHELNKKLFGVYPHTVNTAAHRLFRGFDDTFYVPHSRHTTLHKEEILIHPDLAVLSESKEAGVYIVSNESRKEFYITGHSEYAPLALHKEYMRDMKKGLTNVDIPVNYYLNNNPQQAPNVMWRSHANLLFTNWVHHFVVE